jgi:hypothetical protein
MDDPGKAKVFIRASYLHGRIGEELKIILSRKGFDSSFGGYTSPILPDEKMFSLPLKDNLRYSDLTIDDGL